MNDGDLIAPSPLDRMGVEAMEGWLLPDFDCRHDWQPGCGASKPAECDCWPGVER